MKIKVIFYPDSGTWTAYPISELTLKPTVIKGAFTNKDLFGVGDTQYEAIGRLMCVLNAVHDDFTIEFTLGE